jgi:hypothetical protein
MSEDNCRARPGLYTLEDEDTLFFGTTATDP